MGVIYKGLRLMKNKILILGNGYMANRLRQQWDCPVYEKRILSYQDALAAWQEHKPEF